MPLKSNSHTYSNFNLHGNQFMEAIINDDNYTDKNILIVKNSIYDKTKNANVIPDAGEDYANVIFLYLGEQITITWTSGTTQVFKSKAIYKCMLDSKDSTYKWVEYEISGPTAWETVNIKPESGDAVDTPKESKAGQEYRVLSKGTYTTAWEGDTQKSTAWCDIGDILICASVNDEGKDATYTRIPSGNDVQIAEKPVSELSTTADWEITNELGSDDAFVDFYLIEIGADYSRKTPFTTGFYITPKTDDVDSKIFVHFDSLPESEDATTLKVQAIIHCL